MRRLFVFVVVMSMVLAACGGDSGDSGEDDSDQPVTTQPAPEGDDDSDQDPPSTEAEGGDDGDDDTATEGEGPSTATVTIGSETYNFSSEGALVAQCLPDLFGVMSVQLPMVDGEGSIQIVALHEETDPSVVEQINVVHVTVGDVDWVADPGDVRIEGKPEFEGESQVDSVQVNGSTVTGTATFVGSQSVFDASSEMATGTFEATCGEERLS